MWLWRRLERISWMDKKSNEEVLIMVNENRCLIRTIYQRKKNRIGHVPRRGVGGRVRRASGFCHVYEADPSSVPGSATLFTNIDVSSLSMKIVATRRYASALCQPRR